MISNISRNLIYVSLLLLMAGTLGGWAIIEKLNGHQGDYGFLYLGMTITAMVFCAQCWMYFSMRGRIFFGLVFLNTLGLSLAWFMLALFIPLLWVDIAGLSIRFALLVLLIVLSASNAVKGYRFFYEKWSELEERDRMKILARQDNFIGWDGVILWMNFSPDLYIPGLSKNITKIVSVIMLFFMLVGFGLRNIFPAASIVAVGVPSALVISFFFQQIGFNMAQARKVRELECEYKVALCQKQQKTRLRKNSRKKRNDDV
jgi:hypothetical protein